MFCRLTEYTCINNYRYTYFVFQFVRLKAYEKSNMSCHAVFFGIFCLFSLIAWYNDFYVGRVSGIRRYFSKFCDREQVLWTKTIEVRVGEVVLYILYTSPTQQWTVIVVIVYAIIIILWALRAQFDRVSGDVHRQ